MKKRNKEDIKLKIYFINPNCQEKFEELLKIIIVEKIKSKNMS